MTITVSFSLKNHIFIWKQNIVSGNLIKFYETYLQNRKQRVLLNVSHFDEHQIVSGVPPGSVLGLLLFLVDIHKNLVVNSVTISIL